MRDDLGRGPRAWTTREEIRLAKGREPPWIKGDLAALPLSVAISALVLAGVLSESAILIALSAFALVRCVCIYRRERQIEGALKAQREIAAAPA